MSSSGPEPSVFRQRVRRGQFSGPTGGVCPGYAQANLVAVPREHSSDFLTFCARNPRACPVIDVTDPGDPTPSWAAPSADLRTDLPSYRVYRGGRLAEERESVESLWRPDLVSVLLGCSFTFERALAAAGVPLRHLQLGLTVPMYVTGLAARPAGPFSGPVVATMRSIPEPLVSRAVVVTSRFPRAHGAPIHIGDPASIGVGSLEAPDFGDPVPVKPGEVPVFWACGVTTQMALAQSGVDLAITHSPGHLFVTDLLDEELSGV